MILHAGRKPRPLFCHHVEVCHVCIRWGRRTLGPMGSWHTSTMATSSERFPTQPAPVYGGTSPFNLHSYLGAPWYGHGAQMRAPAAAPPIPPVAPVADGGRLRLYGPDIGNHEVAAAEESTPVSVSTLSTWAQRAAQEHITGLDLYVHLHRSTAKLVPARRDPVDPAVELADPILRLDQRTETMLGLPAATHTLTLNCDSVAPRARLDLYVLNATRRGVVAPVPTAASSGAPRPAGWLLSSVDVVHGFDMQVSLPLVLDAGWGTEEDQLALAVMIEALDEDGHVLAEPNAQTMLFTATTPDAGESWRLASGAQSVYLNGYTMQLHQLFGMTTQAGALAADESAVPVVPDPGPLNDVSECPICMSLEPTTVLLPCTHALCVDCAVGIRDRVHKARGQDCRHGRAPRMNYTCPLCRAEIQSMLALSR